MSLPKFMILFTKDHKIKRPNHLIHWWQISAIRTGTIVWKWRGDVSLVYQRKYELTSTKKIKSFLNEPELSFGCIRLQSLYIQGESRGVGKSEGGREGRLYSLCRICFPQILLIASMTSTNLGWSSTGAPWCH